MPKPRLQIRVTDRRTGVASDHRFTTGPVRIGREPGNELQLADPYVSAEHARLDLDDLGAHLHDLGGTNGLRVAGRRLAPNTTAHPSTSETQPTKMSRLRRQAPADGPDG